MTAVEVGKNVNHQKLIMTRSEAIIHGKIQRRNALVIQNKENVSTEIYEHIIAKWFVGEFQNIEKKFGQNR